LSRKDGQSARTVGRGTRIVPARATGTASPLPNTTPICKGCKHHHIVDPMTRRTRKWVTTSTATGTFTDDHLLRRHCSQGHHRTRRGHEAQQTHIDIRYHYERELVQIGEIAVEWVAASLMVAWSGLVYYRGRVTPICAYMSVPRLYNITPRLQSYWCT